MEFWKKYKLVWLFLLKFFGFYSLGVFLYHRYLALSDNHLDPFTSLITEQVVYFMSLTLPEVSVFYSPDAPFAQVLYYGVPVISMIEGCNAVSVNILFISFLLAFTGPFIRYVWFVPMGLIVMYVSNVIRIYALALVVLYYPNLTNIAHDYFFPGVIYGTVFILWVFWVRLTLKTAK
jgi:exosortase family protein XrtF